MNIGFQILIQDDLLKTITKALEVKPSILQTFLTSHPHSVAKNTVIRMSHTEGLVIKKLLKKQNMKLVIHSNYLLNFCSYPPTSKRIQWALNYYIDELTTAYRIGAIGSIIHIGAKKDLSTKEAYNNFVKCIKYVIKHKPKSIKIIFELTAGGGSKVAYKIEDFYKLWNMFSKEDKKHLKICLDTAHIFLSGYPIHTLDGLNKFLINFDKLIGFENVAILHLNDAKYKCGSHRDVHEKLGKGYLFNKKLGGSIECLYKLLLFAKEHKKYVILETSKDYKRDFNNLQKFITKLNQSKNNSKKNTVVKIFKELADIYKALGDQFRHKAYNKAVASLKKYNGELLNTKIEGIGKSMESKIKEIIETNELKLLEELKKQTSNTRNLQKILGIGPVQASKFIKQGILSTKNLEKAVKNKKIKLDDKQTLGLKYLKNLEKTITIATMKKYKKYIQSKLYKNIEREIKVELVGSYLTGKAKKEGAHDIDLLITFPSIKKRKDLKTQILKVKDALNDVIVNVFSSGKNRMSFLAKMKDDKYVRHIDILITSLESYYPALLYFGSGVEESRRIRQTAKDKGYKLNEYELLHIKTGKKIYSKKEIDEICEI